MRTSLLVLCVACGGASDPPPSGDDDDDVTLDDTGTPPPPGGLTIDGTDLSFAHAQGIDGCPQSVGTVLLGNGTADDATFLGTVGDPTQFLISPDSTTVAAGTSETVEVLFLCSSGCQTDTPADELQFDLTTPTDSDAATLAVSGTCETPTTVPDEERCSQPMGMGLCVRWQQGGFTFTHTASDACPFPIGPLTIDNGTADVATFTITSAAAPMSTDALYGFAPASGTVDPGTAVVSDVDYLCTAASSFGGPDISVEVIAGSDSLVFDIPAQGVVQ